MVRWGGWHLLILALIEVFSGLMPAAAQQPMWLIGYMPFTAENGGPLDGLSQREAVNIMLEQINSNPALLPGQELKIVWQDDHCNADTAGNYILNNVFYREYTVFAPGASLASLDVDGDGAVEYNETNPLEEVWNSSDVDPSPVGVIGASCSDVTEKLVDVCFAAKLPLVSGGATSADLSNRESYKNFFRTIIPDQDLSGALLALVKFFDHTEVAAITGTSDAWAARATAFAKVAIAANIHMRGRSVTGVDHFNGSRVSTQEQAVSATIQLLRTKVRIVILLLEADAVRLVLCQAYQHQFMNAVWMGYKSIGLNFWDTPVDGCTQAQVKTMASGFILASMVFWREDATQQLTCSANMTAADFETEWWTRVGNAPGNYGTNSMGFAPVDSAATWADATCMYALALHQAISVRGLSVVDLAARSTSTYAAMVEELDSTDFQGVQGRLWWNSTQNQVEPRADMKIQQLQGANLDYVTLATYTDSSLVLKGGTFMFGLSNNIAATPGLSKASPPLIQFEQCPAPPGLEPNSRLITSTNVCEICPSPQTTFVETDSEVGCLCSKGYKKDNAGNCQACPPGEFSTSFGVTTCRICGAGEYTGTAGQSVCTICDRGRYGSNQGMSQCTQCPTNKDTETSGGQSLDQCVCAADYFASNTSAGTCQACPSGATSQVGSTSVEDCECPSNHYMSADFTSCEQCPKDSTTSATGRTQIKQCFCPQAQYMNVDQCLPCPRGMVCPKGSNAANTHVLGQGGIPTQLRDQEQQFPGLEPNFWSSEARPFEVYQCRSSERCPGRDNFWPGKACAGNLKDSNEDIACEHCIPEYYWTGTECARCTATQSSLLIFPVLPILLIPCIIAGFYKFFGDPLPKWGSWQNSTAALLFIILNHYQVLGVLSQMSMDLPDRLTDLLGFYSNTNDFSTSFSVDCVSLRELVPSMIMKACLPFVLVWACFTVYFASHFLSRFFNKPVLAMEKNRLFNVLGSLMFTFFGAIAGMSMQLFKCSPNPDLSPPTLASDRSVVCWTGNNWTSGLGVGIACVAVYIIGVGGLFCRAIYKAPIAFGDPGFQMRWKFLFIKFHSGAYWWGIMFLMKNFLVNLVPVVWSEQVARLYVSMSVILGYLSLVVLVKPYRAEVANFFEMLAGVCIMFVTSLLTWHADRLEEVVNGEEIGKYDTQITLATIAISFVPVVLLPCGVIFLKKYGKEIVPSTHSAEKARRLFETLKGTYSSFVSLEVETGVFTLLHLGDAELRTLEDAAFLINTDILGLPSRYRVASRSIYQSNGMPQDAVSV